MAIITFIKDVTNASEPDGTGPHYRAGYCVDASPDFARQAVAEGNAVYGVIAKLETAPIKEGLPADIADEELPKTPKRKRGWKA